MASPLDITRIPAPRVAFLDDRTGQISREWYRFLYNLFILTGSGNNAVSLDEVQLGPPNNDQFVLDLQKIADAQTNDSPLVSDVAEMEKQIQQLEVVPPVQNNNFVNTNYVDFEQSAPFTRQIARAGWNTSDQTLDLGMDYGVTQQIGQETYARVRNSTGVTIPNGTAVGFVGAATDALSVAPYLADGSQPTLYILGIMTHDLPDSGEKGYCTTWGFVRDLDTSAFSAGDVLYVSSTVAGELTNVKPTAPANVIPIAAVVVSDATAGVIFVRPTITQMQYYGVFSKTSDQTPASANTAYALTFDATDISNGVVIGTPTSRIVVPQSGLYNFNVSVQITSGNTSAKNVWVWLRKNGTDIANSARLVTININNGYVPVSFSEPVSMTASQYVEVMFAADDTAITIDNVASTAFAPAAPAVALEVTQVQQ
jgi:hypothetical protein